MATKKRSVAVARAAKSGSVRSTARGATAAAIEDLVAASRILAMHEVVDAFGHVSIRHPEHPDRYLISRSLAPELLTAADLMEFDLDSNTVRKDDRKPFTERFIHGQIYKARPEVMAVVHSHSPTVVPFGAVGEGLRPIYHMSGFLHAGTPIFDIRETAGDTNMLVRDNYLGAALVKTLGNCSVALMRGHGNVIVAPNVRLAVYRAIYTEMNARLQMQARILGGKPMYLSTKEAQLAEESNIAALDRPWELWKAKAMAQLKREKRA